MVESKFKNSDIGLIPEDWNIVNLSERCTLKARIGWQGLTTSEYLKNGNYYLITGTDFKNGYIDWSNCVYVDKSRYKQDKNIQIKTNDVLITKDGTIGKIAFIEKVEKPTTLNSGVFVLRSKDENLHSRFIYYILMSFYFDVFLNKITAGSTITHLYQKDFIHFNFILPSLSEQKAIATVLADTDTWINSLENLITKKCLVKQGAMQKLFAPNEDWEVKFLGEVADFFKGKGLPKNDIDSNGNIKCIHYGELFTKHKEIIKKVINKTFNFASSFLSKENDVLMPTSDVTPRGLATASCIKEEGVLLGGDILIIRFKKEIEGSFFSYFVSNNKDEILKLVSGSTVYHLYGSELSGLIFKYPKLKSEQTRIASILSDMDAEIENLEKKLIKAKQLRQGMMQQLLKGKIRLANYQNPPKQ